MTGLSFLSPWFLIGAAAALVPIVIHLFYRRRAPVLDFAAMRYLRSAPVERTSQRRIKDLLLLALRVLALLLLAFAFARPYIDRTAQALSAPATILLLDTTASLSAPGSLQRMRARAEQLIRSLPAGQLLGVMTFGAGVDLVAPLSTDRSAAATAVSRLTVSAGATGYRRALARAAEELAGRAGRVVVLSDLQESGWAASDDGGISDRVTVEAVDVGGPLANIAVSGLRMESAEAVATVRNYGERGATLQVRFSLDARVLGAVPVTVAPRGSAEARIRVQGAATGALAAAIDDRDGFAADNVRYAVVGGDGKPDVLLVTSAGGPSEAFYIERALTVSDGVNGFRVRRISGPQFSSLSPDMLADVEVVTILGTRGIEHRGRDLLSRYVREGGGLLLTNGADVDPAVVREALGAIVGTSSKARDVTGPLQFAPDDTRHPIFRPFEGVGTLAHVEFARAALLVPSAQAAVIARFSDGSAALVEERVSAGRVLIFASDLNRQGNDFPLQPTFVPFVHETIRYLASIASTRTDYFVGDLGGPSGRTVGVVSTTEKQPGRRRVAVNVDPRESDPVRMSVGMFLSQTTGLETRGAQAPGRAETPDREGTERLWQYGLVLMLVALMAESLLGRRFGS